jgi:serine/threonine-protein kinase
VGQKDEAGVAPTLLDASTPGEGSSDLRRTVLSGRYEIEALLGSGGMGTVYRARDQELDEVVALKMLQRGRVDEPKMLARFKQEVKLARRVTHKNVARTFDIGEHEGDRFLTMEYIDGEPLSALSARTGPMPLARVVDLACGVCAGLAAAHAAGVVHRDLKPDNVLLAKDGRVVITDFGIARAFTEGGAKTQGAPMGTPAYMAPEQVEGASVIDARADIYALGAMLFELLTGERAWTGESVYQIAALRLVMPPPDPREKRKSVPDAAARVVLKCMARNRDDRYATADEVASALTQLTLPAMETPTTMSAAPAVVAQDMKSIAVLPLRNSGAAGDEYLADGLTEDLIDTLSMGKGLRVRSRGAVMRFKGVDKDPREVGRDLDVQVVADGSVRCIGDVVRVSVRLVSVSDGFQLWAKRFERPRADLLKIGDEAANAIADALTLSLGAPSRAAPTDPAALDLYLRARHEYHKSWRDAMQRAIVLFEQALERAPRDPQIMTGLAMALCRRFAYDESASDDADRAVALAEAAIALAPERGEPRVAIANIRMNHGQSRAAASELRRALDLAPNSADVQELAGRMLAEAGRPEDGIARFMLARQIDPAFEATTYDIARARALLGEWDEAETAFTKVPDESLMNIHWMSRWRTLMWRHDTARAQRALELIETQSFPLKPAAVAMLTMTATKQVAPEALAELDARGAAGRAIRRRAFFCQIKAEVLAYVGDVGEMLLSLEESEKAGLFDITWLDRCPLFDPYRADPRFKVVRDKVAARAADVIAALLPR